MCKKLICVLVVCALAGIASADTIGDIDGTTTGASLPGQVDDGSTWMTGQYLHGPLWPGGYSGMLDSVAGAGVGGSDGATVGNADGVVTGNYDCASYSLVSAGPIFVANVLANPGSGRRGLITLADAAFTTSPTTSANVVIVDELHEVSGAPTLLYRSAADAIVASNSRIASAIYGGGWMEYQLTYDSVAGTAILESRDVDDTTGAPLTAWVTNSTMSGMITFTPTVIGLASYEPAPISFDAVPEPATIALLGLGALTLIRKRK